MKTSMEKNVHTIDASGRTLGRVASEAASALMGKTSPRFAKNTVLPVSVVITNVKKLFLSERRLAGTFHVRYTGYPGGLKTTALPELIAKKGVAEALKKAIQGMIPRNKLRAPRMKNLTIKD